MAFFRNFNGERNIRAVIRRKAYSDAVRRRVVVQESDAVEFIDIGKCGNARLMPSSVCLILPGPSLAGECERKKITVYSEHRRESRCNDFEGITVYTSLERRKASGYYNNVYDSATRD